jgi:hypothetical protein
MQFFKFFIFIIMHLKRFVLNDLTLNFKVVCSHKLKTHPAEYRCFNKSWELLKNKKVKSFSN